MYKDLSLELYEKYYSLNNRNICLTTKDNNIYHGTFQGFFKGDTNFGENYILKWRFKLNNHDFDEWLINQNEIKQVQFEEDNTILKF